MNTREVRDSENSKVVASATLRWSELNPTLWYKATVRESILGMHTGDKIWLKQNTELPFRGGLTYWLYDPIRKKAVNISEKLIHEYARLYIGGNATATTQEQKVLDKHWLPIVKEKVEFQRKVIKHFNKETKK